MCGRYCQVALQALHLTHSCPPSGSAAETTQGHAGATTVPRSGPTLP